MIQYKCSSCGGEMTIGGSGGFVCPYCGSKTFMSDADFRGNEVFRKKLLEYYKAEAENKEYDYGTDTMWKSNGNISYTMNSGQPLSVKYMYKYDYNDFECYLAKETVVYIFNNEKCKNRFKEGIQRLVFPEADTKLHRCFPKLKMEVSLTGEKEVLVFERRPNFYPVYLFEPLESEHLAWVISRMENICCELTYSEIQHGGINEKAIWINPITHEGALFGDWGNVKALSGVSDIKDVRRTAISIAKNEKEPKELYEFLHNAPAKDAYEDFEKWDKVINEGFGGHRFVKM